MWCLSLFLTLLWGKWVKTSWIYSNNFFQMFLSVGWKIRWSKGWRMVLWCDLICPLSWGTTFWWWQSETTIGKSQKGKLSYTPLCASRLSEFTSGYDWSWPRKTFEGKEVILFFGDKNHFKICVLFVVVLVFVYC